MFTKLINLLVSMGRREVSGLDKRAAKAFDNSEALKKLAAKEHARGVALLNKAVDLEVRVDKLEQV